MRQPPVDYIARTKALYSHLGYPPYHWAAPGTAPPFQPLRKPLSESKLALLSSGGIYRTGQTAFHYRDDMSLRLLSADVATKDLRATHFAYDLTDARKDPNVVFPIDRIRDLVRDGIVGEVTGGITFMGGIYSQRRVENGVAPTIADLLVSQEVDVALLVPV